MAISRKNLVITIIILSGMIIVVSGCLFLASKNKVATTGHYATIMSREFYGEAYMNAPATIKSDKDTVGGIVNHHLLAAPLLAQFFDGLRNQNPKHVIIIGPDHMSRGKKSITVSAEGWKTGYGDVMPDSALVDRFRTNTPNSSRILQTSQRYDQHAHRFDQQRQDHGPTRSSRNHQLLEPIFLRFHYFAAAK